MFALRVSLSALVFALVLPAVALAQDPAAPAVAPTPAAAPAAVTAPAPAAAPAAATAPAAPAVAAAPLVENVPVPASTDDAAVDGAGDEPGDRVTFGADVVVREGERVRDLVTMGGDAVIDGEVLGSVVTMGGDATVRGHVVGDVVTMGGDAQVKRDAVIDGEVTTMGGTLEASPGASTGGVTTMGDTELSGLAAIGTIGGLAAFVHSALSGAASFALLFLLGLLMIGAASDRFDALKVVAAREPLHVFLLGGASFVAAVFAIFVLAITIIGIPASIAVAIALSLGCYLGLATVAAVIGALLPIAQLRERPVLQLAAGVTTLYLASLVPGVGTLALMVAGAIGLGAVVRTRLRVTAPPSAPATPAGAYRTSSYPEGA